jgi:hypothetical protein
VRSQKAQSPPSGRLWLHEIKHVGFRVIARKNGVKVQLYSRPGNARKRKIGAMTGVFLRRVKPARPSAQHDDDYDVIEVNGLVIGPLKSATSRFVGTPWTWTLFSKEHEDPRAGLYREARGCHRCVCQELAAGLSDVLFMQQISGKRITRQKNPLFR